MAEPSTAVPQQPFAPQGQVTRGSPNGMWPNSPAAPSAPTSTLPSSTTAPPRPASTCRCRATRAPARRPGSIRRPRPGGVVAGHEDVRWAGRSGQSGRRCDVVPAQDAGVQDQVAGDRAGHRDADAAQALPVPVPQLGRPRRATVAITSSPSGAAMVARVVDSVPPPSSTTSTRQDSWVIAAAATSGPAGCGSSAVVGRPRCRTGWPEPRRSARPGPAGRPARWRRRCRRRGCGPPPPG